MPLTLMTKERMSERMSEMERPMMVSKVGANYPVKTGVVGSDYLGAEFTTLSQIALTLTLTLSLTRNPNPNPIHFDRDCAVALRGKLSTSVIKSEPVTPGPTKLGRSKHGVKVRIKVSSSVMLGSLGIWIALNRQTRDQQTGTLKTCAGEVAVTVSY